MSNNIELHTEDYDNIDNCQEKNDNCHETNDNCHDKNDNCHDKNDKNDNCHETKGDNDKNKTIVKIIEVERKKNFECPTCKKRYLTKKSRQQHFRRYCEKKEESINNTSSEYEYIYSEEEEEYIETYTNKPKKNNTKLTKKDIDRMTIKYLNPPKVLWGQKMTWFGNIFNHS